MKIVSWNAEKKWRGTHRLLRHNQDVDIFSLQEVPAAFELEQKDFPGLKEVRIPDFIHRRQHKSMYLTVVTRHDIVEVKTVRYFDRRITSPMTLYYRIRGDYQVYDALLVKIRVDGIVYSIVNVHLPIAASAPVRKEMLISLFEQVKDLENPIITGDLNVYDRIYLTVVFGLFRGFRFKELFFNERNDAEDLFIGYGFHNIFAGTRTALLLATQFDHILINNSLRVVNKKRLHRYHSDHFAIMAEVETCPATE